MYYTKTYLSSTNTNRKGCQNLNILTRRKCRSWRAAAWRFLEPTRRRSRRRHPRPASVEEPLRRDASRCHAVCRDAPFTPFTRDAGAKTRSPRISAAEKILKNLRFSPTAGLFRFAHVFLRGLVQLKAKTGCSLELRKKLSETQDESTT